MVTQVRPGLSGVGSIVFRTEEEIMHGRNASVDFYDNVIAPYKGRLRVVRCKQKHLYLLCAIYYGLGGHFSKDALIWTVFRALPAPPRN